MKPRLIVKHFLVGILGLLVVTYLAVAIIYMVLGVYASYFLSQP
jgi:hypothetical protein